MGIVPVAVSITTESSDHYLHLFHVSSVEHFIEKWKKWMDDELKYVYRHDVESNIPEFNKELKNALQAEIESRWED